MVQNFLKRMLRTFIREKFSVFLRKFFTIAYLRKFICRGCCCPRQMPHEMSQTLSLKNRRHACENSSAVDVVVANKRL